MPLPVAAASPLTGQPSAYLQLHADDPVHWRVWDKALLAEAQRLDRPIFVSSGYFACHWCHVMQRESFRDPAIAALLNRHFIPVKLDRELRPDLDALLFDFVQRTQGVAGWPLNVFLSPDGKPFHGLVYQPPETFNETLRRMAQQWRRRVAAAQDVPTAAGRGDIASLSSLQQEAEQALLRTLASEADLLSGGIGEGSKFPRVPLLTLLLEHYREEPLVREWLTLTLDAMAEGGLQDHLGGGFFRYTVDPQWEVPHFEKMLYDNAQLARLYLRAGELLGNAAYRRVGERTLDFMLRNLWHPRGTFISSLSALDREGRDGAHYLWNIETLQAVLGIEDFERLSEAWGLSEQAPLAHGYLPPLPEPALRPYYRKLMRAREQHAPPRDNKRLAGWNALALRALIDGAALQPRYRLPARRVARYLHSLWDGDRLWLLRDAEGQRHQPAALEDYALVAGALYHWWQFSGETKSRRLAESLVTAAFETFYRQGRWRLGAVRDAGLLERGYTALRSDPLPSPAVELARLQQTLQLELVPEEPLLYDAAPALLARPLEYADYLGRLQERGR